MQRASLLWKQDNCAHAACFMLGMVNPYRIEVVQIYDLLSEKSICIWRNCIWFFFVFQCTPTAYSPREKAVLTSDMNESCYQW